MSYRYFLKIDGVSGGSTDPLHPGAIELDGVSMSDRRGGPTSVGRGYGEISELTVIKRSDSVSGFLWAASANGRAFKEATLTIEKVNLLGFRVKTSVIRMQSVLIEVYSPRHPYEEITLNFASIQFQQGGTQAVKDASSGGASHFDGRGA